jgi:inorganic pyrophosphatase
MDPDCVLCIVEIPRGSRNKYEFDAEFGAIKLDRLLFSSVAYPTDYGYVPETLAKDGDPLDVMIVVSDATFPGCRIEGKLIALFRTHDDAGQDDKLLCVPRNDPNWSHMERLEDIPEQLRDEISHFFSIYKQPEGKHVMVDGWFEVEEARAVLEDSRRRFREQAG